MAPPGSTFYRFPTLPPELRLRIWRFALQTPQMIALHTAAKHGPSGPFGTQYIYANPIWRPLLLVNVEARGAALSAYLPGFYDKSGKTEVWINPKLDTVYLRDISLALLAKYGIAAHLECMAFAFEDWKWFNDRDLIDYFCREMRILCHHMTALKEVQIVAWDEGMLSQRRINMGLSPLNVKWDLAKERQEALRELARGQIRWRNTTTERFRQVMEQTRHSMGSLPPGSSVLVRATALGVSGAESNWDQELELLVDFVLGQHHKYPELSLLL